MKVRKFKSAISRKAKTFGSQKRSSKNNSFKNESNLQRGYSFSNIEPKLNSTLSAGFMLPKSTRSYMERRLGIDFNFVRIHTDNNAVQMNKLLNSRAFTFGNNIYFNRDNFNPGSSEGKRLLAHELAHVIQQSNSIQTKLIQRAGEAEKPVGEKEIDSCSGWERDAESLTIAAARHYFKTELGKDIMVQKVKCEPLDEAIICDLTLSDGTTITVVYSPKVNMVRVQVKDATGKLRFCKYNYSCSLDRTITFTKITCG